jgi:hypothetical protein
MRIYLILLIVCNTLFVTGQNIDDNILVDYFTDNGLSSAVKTMQHPAGEYYKGITYVAYQGPTVDPYVAAYDHTRGKWTGPFKAGESILIHKEPGMIDSHGKPAMIIDDDGYIHLVFGGHGGMPALGINPLGDYGQGMMKHVVTKKPMDITEWKELDNISPFGTYNQFVKMDNGDIYLFYRHGAHRSNWVYQKSSDNGRSFAAPVSVLKTKQTTGTKEQPDIHDTWYAWFDNGQGNDIIATYNYHVCKEPNHDGERHNCYYMAMNTDNNEWYNVKGEILIVPVTKEHADTLTLVTNTGSSWTVRGTARLDNLGRPHVTINVGEHMGLKHGGPKQVCYYRWTGQEWISRDITDLPVATGDILITSPSEASLLLAYKDENIDEVAWWNTSDGGRNFEKGEVLLKRNKANFTNVISSMIRNAHPDARVIVAGEKRKGELRNMYLIGDNGPVTRLKAEADQNVDK